MNSNANDDIKIVRFIDINACKQVFSESYSTFLLRSHEYYWNIEDTDKQDRTEFQVPGENGSMETSSALLSCWTILKGDEPTETDWKIFEKDSPVVAIISSPQKVYNFLHKILNIGRRNGRTHPFFHIEHKGVDYIDKKIEKLPGTPTISDAIFTKDKRFIPENEYRFAVYYSTILHEINTYIFHVQDPDEYMDKYYFNPSSTEAKALLDIVLRATAGYGPFDRKKLCDIIANSDILIDRVKMDSCRRRNDYTWPF